MSQHELVVTVVVAAHCADCGTEVDPDTLRGRAVDGAASWVEAQSDRGGATLRVIADVPCGACGSGRYQVRCDFSPSAVGQ